MAAVISRARAGRAEPRARQAEHRLSGLFQREIAPRLAGLERQRLRYRRGYMLAAAAMLAGIFAVFVLVQSLWHAIVAGAIVLAIGVALMEGIQRGYLNQVRRTVMPAICAAIGDLRHEVGTAPDLDLRRLAEVGIVPGHTRRRIDDVFSGRHRSIGFTMAEVRLRRAGGGRRRRSGTVFRGLLFAIDVPRPVPARILIARDGGLIGNGFRGWIKRLGGMERVPLAAKDFEARFEVYADRLEVARAAMTPELQANLVALAAAHGGAPFQAAFADGRFFLAMPRRGDQLRIGSVLRPTGRLESEAAQLLHDVQLVHRIIDFLHGDRPSLRPDAGSARADRARDGGPDPVVRC